MRKSSPNLMPIAKILPKALKQWKPDEKGILGALGRQWDKIVGTALSRQTIPLSLHGNCLIVGVQSSAYANELQLLQTQILKKIDEEVPAALIKKVRFQTVTRPFGSMR